MVSSTLLMASPTRSTAGRALLWWHRIVASHKVVMGWKMSPSHNLGAQLEDVWLNQ
jgi:hypothetical protein